MENSVFGFEYSKNWEYENGFYLTSHPSRLAKSISHWELYKKIIDLPGAIVECGVFKGASIIRFATFREMAESQYSRKIIGFDAFGKFPAAEAEDDKNFIIDFESASGEGISKSELEKILIKKGFDNIELIKGNVLKTISAYLEANPYLKIALLHLDVDVYEATTCCLETLYDKVVTGGIIALDDYSAVSGATKAVDDFFKSRNIDIQIKKLTYNKIPCYIIKK